MYQFHLESEAVYHLYQDCEAWMPQNDETIYPMETGGKPLCEECAARLQQEKRPP